MRLALALAGSMFLFSTAASAQAPASPPEGGVVHRLLAEEIDALLNRKAAEPRRETFVKDQADTAASLRLNKTGQVATGVLGFLGHAAAETAFANKCGLFGLTCAGLSSNAGRTLDVVR